MIDKLKVLVVVLCMLSFAEAGTVSIGTASARGDMRVDSYTVKGGATLFDGSVVETGQASADLHLCEGTEITMASSSRCNGKSGPQASTGRPARRNHGREFPT